MLDKPSATYVSTDTVGLVGTVIDGVVALGDSVVVLGVANHCESVICGFGKEEIERIVELIWINS